tara:strand:- start:123255 stop:124046 length:792 start_codon:yes stop_codon:yes gene_type:complete
VKLHRALTIVGLTATIAMAGPAIAASKATFSPQQTEQIQTIVHDYLLDNPDILIQVSQKLQEQQQEQMQKMEQQAQSTIPTIAPQLFNSKSPESGNPKGDVTIVEFFDYQCGHCKDMNPVLDGLKKSDKNLRVVYKEFPIFGGASLIAAKAALAAQKQGKYLELHEALMNADNPLSKDKIYQLAESVSLNTDQLKKDMDSDEVKQELKANLKLAQKLGVRATPAFIVGSTQKANKGVKSFLIPGGTSEEVLGGVVEQVRNNKS